MTHYFFIKAILVFGLCFVATFYGSLTGGGALISIPGLVLLGFNPAVAIATVRVGALGSVPTALYGFHKAGKVNYKIGIPAAICAAAGSIIGASILVNIPSKIIQPLVGVFIILTLVVMFVTRAGIGNSTTVNISWLRKYIGYLLFFIIGIWGGFFGATGTLISYLFMFLYGVSFLESAGTRKLVTLFIVLVSLPIFSFKNLIDWRYSIIIFIAMTLGAYCGVRCGIKWGDVWMRRLFALVVILLALKMLCY
jgi:uncharacterized protein